MPAVPRPARKRLFALLTAVAALGAALTATAGASAQAAEPTTPVRTYETEQLNAAPSGCSVPAGRVAPAVSNVRAHTGSRSLRFNDQTVDAQVAGACPVAARAGGDLEFAVYPVKVPNGYTMSLLGHWQGGTGAAVPVFHLAVFSDGSFKWHDGGSIWTRFAPPGTVPTAKWSTVRVQVDPADQSKAKVSVNGTVVGEVKPAGQQAVRDVSGYQFASSGTMSAGDEVFFDDVAMVNERGYETEPVGSVPEACATPAAKQAGTVVGAGAATGSRALRLNDRSAEIQAVVQCQISPQRGIDWEFSANPATLQNAAVFSLLGQIEDNVVSAPRVVFRVAAYADGSLRWYDGRGWTAVAKSATLPAGRWSRVRVQVPTDMESARIFVDGKFVAAAGPAGIRKVTALTGYEFASSGTESLNDDIFVDDVTVRPAVDGPLPGGTGGVGLGAYASVEKAATGKIVQMPHGAVAFPTAQGTEALVTYARHIDDTPATGTGLRSSTNLGTGWTDATNRNPFPAEQSFHLTRLPDGRVIAVNYHTFMVPGSGELKMSIEIAKYSTETRSWTRADGVLTAPQKMRPITQETSRPGSRLGGFLLVHNVVVGSDGAWNVAGYGYYLTDGTKFRQVLLRSTDEGKTWTVQATVAKNDTLSTHPSYEGFGEGAAEFVGDNGEMLMVMRTGSYLPMYYARSTDFGLTWSTPAILRAGPDQLPVTGVNPMLLRAPGGKLLLHIGRPGQSLLVSPDGKGESWDSPVVIDYRNSGNGSFIMTGDNQFLALSDRGQNWGVPKPPLVPEIWSRKITLTP